MVSKVSATTDLTVTSIPLACGHTVSHCWSLLWNELVFSHSPELWSRVFQAPKVLLSAFASFTAAYLCPFWSFLSLPSLLLFLFFLLLLHLFFFIFQLTSSLVFLTLSILHGVHVSIASSSSCQIGALPLHAIWIRVILDTETLCANLHASMEMANTQSRTNSHDSGGNQRLSHFLVHQWPPSSP